MATALTWDQLIRVNIQNDTTWFAIGTLETSWGEAKYDVTRNPRSSE